MRIWGFFHSYSLANRVLPRSLHLPYPSIFGTHGAIKGSTNGVPLSEPLPPRAQDSLHLTDTHSARSAEDDAKNPHHKHQKHHHQSHQSHEEKAEKGLQLPGAQSGELKKDEGAKVVVTPGEDGDQKKSFDLAAHQYTQASQNPHPAQPVQTGTGNANNRSGSSGKGETLFDKIEVPDATQGAGAHASAGASQHAGKKGAKKGAAHEKAPTFEQSLQQA